MLVYQRVIIINQWMFTVNQYLIGALGRALMITFLAPPPMCRAAWEIKVRPVTSAGIGLMMI
jgi:hypothetical protein